MHVSRKKHHLFNDVSSGLSFHMQERKWSEGGCTSILGLSFSCVYVRVSEQGMQIHISQTTKDHLEHEPYIIEERGKIFVKVSAACRWCGLFFLTVPWLRSMLRLILYSRKAVRGVTTSSSDFIFLSIPFLPEHVREKKKKPQLLITTFTISIAFRKQQSRWSNPPASLTTPVCSPPRIIIMCHCTAAQSVTKGSFVWWTVDQMYNYIDSTHKKLRWAAAIESEAK